MPFQVAVQMDPIERVNIETDTTFLMMLEAQTRGHGLFIYAPDKLSLDDGRVLARGRAVNLRAVKGDHHTVGEVEVRDLSEFDVVLMRQDPPFDMAYITATYFLEKIQPGDVGGEQPGRGAQCAREAVRHRLSWPAAADPDHRRRRGPARLPRQGDGDIVLKPLYGGAGSGVVKLAKGDPNLDALLELHAMISREAVIAQKFIPAVSKGDKRILLVDGEPVGAINRVPGEGQVRSNLARGGRAEPVELNARDREICDTIALELKDRGLLFVGIDVIGDYLTEINVTSPTEAQQLETLRRRGRRATALWDRIQEIRGII